MTKLTLLVDDSRIDFEESKCIGPSSILTDRPPDFDKFENPPSPKGGQMNLFGTLGMKKATYTNMEEPIIE